MKQLKGAFPVLITPMNEHGEINFSGLKQNIEHFINQGVAGIVVNGSTGEFVSLTQEERFKVTETAVAQVNGRIPLIVGTAAETTADAITYTKQAEDAGADAALLINSYYAHPKDEEIYEHFKTVAESVSLPIMIYNNPFTSGVDIGQGTILKVARDVNNITHIKESSGEIRKVRDITRQGKGFLQTFCGADDLVLESLLVGATGWISVAGNIAPQLATDLFNCVQEGHYEKAWDLYDRILPLCNFLEGSGKYVQIVKRAMDLQGLAGGPSRKPRLSLTEEEDATLQEILNSMFAFEK
ncbi:4-hydroxy-tetrahydrodipicolinate synthase [Halobacillus shinanisalinarum]|uniref:4-hydroxy-tetrahydrodipicolinate synthase n=1 Tax=Halobacillus shinanisalinarum TaxID=2932258 RepID=A0ABY4H4E9_9BACI|nr:4-hydroxy-tetrahydrodipicolinate synthase [Halobacillus shinanisalinarum]UOQ94775.1 4-hydroxy-tetrahydrodipicolinate synthase [Halobacillus shinanisalinarum]